MEFELSNKTLTLTDSYDIFEGEIGTFPYHMSVVKKEKQYYYNFEEG